MCTSSVGVFNRPFNVDYVYLFTGYGLVASNMLDKLSQSVAGLVSGQVAFFHPQLFSDAD